MIQKSLLGRYECINDETNTYKFWHIIFNTLTNEYLIHYARIGKSANIYPSKDEKKMLTKIKEKLRKGYVKVAGYEEMVGTQSIDFIKNILGA